MVIFIFLKIELHLECFFNHSPFQMLIEITVSLNGGTCGKLRMHLTIIVKNTNDIDYLHVELFVALFAITNNTHLCY